MAPLNPTPAVCVNRTCGVSATVFVAGLMREIALDSPPG